MALSRSRGHAARFVRSRSRADVRLRRARSRAPPARARDRARARRARLHRAPRLVALASACASRRFALAHGTRAFVAARGALVRRRSRVGPRGPRLVASRAPLAERRARARRRLVPLFQALVKSTTLFWMTASRSSTILRAWSRSASRSRRGAATRSSITPYRAAVRVCQLRVALLHHAPRVVALLQVLRQRLLAVLDHVARLVALAPPHASHVSCSLTSARASSA